MAANTSEAKLHAQDLFRVLRQRWHLVLLTVLLSVGVAIVITKITPKEYVGTVEFRLEFERFISSSVGGADAMGRAVNQNMQIEDEFHTITSQKILDTVVDELDLVSRWASENKAAARKRLDGSIKPRSLRQSSTFVVEVYDRDADLAAIIANKLADVYEEYRRNLDKEQLQKANEIFGTKINEAEKSVSEARQKITEIESLHGIVPIQNTNLTADARSQVNIADRHDMERGDVLKELIKQKNEYEQLKAVVSEIRRNKDEGAWEEIAARLSEEFDTVKTRMTEKADIQHKIINLRSEGIGEKHREMVGVKQQLVQLELDLKQNVENAMRILEGRVETSGLVLADLEKRSNSLETETNEKSPIYAEYRQAHDELKRRLGELEYVKSQQLDIAIKTPLLKAPITRLENAEADPRNPVKPRPTLNLILGIVMGLVFGLILAFSLEFLDNSVKSIEDVEQHLGASVLAVIPKDVGVLHKQSGMSPDAEAYRILRTNIEFNRRSANANSICVVSGGAGEGKSTTLVNLAYVCAQGGYTTLIIDADLRRPKMHTFFDINNTVGLTNYLTTDLPLESVILQTPIENLYFMPSGILPADAAGILNSQRMTELIQDVKNRFDLVLLDSPPILGVSDASVICSEVDLTMIVIQHRKLPKHMLSRVKQAVENVGGNIVGVVLNNVDVRGDTQYQYYTSYYTYYSPVQNKHNSPKPQPAPQPAAVEEASPFGWSNDSKT